MTCFNCSRLSVKSCLTRTAPPWNVMIASRSIGCIWSSMYLIAAVYARTRSGGGIADKSKYRTTRRRSRYLMLPGTAAAEICAGAWAVAVDAGDGVGAGDGAV